MSYSLSSRNLSSRSLGGCIRYPASSCGSFYPGSSCGSFYPGNVAYSQGTCQQGSPLYGGCQETCGEPPSCQTPYYGRRSSRVCGPCHTTYSQSSGCGSTGLGPFGYESCRPQSLGCGTSCYRPPYSSSRSYQSSCFQPTCGSGYYGQTY